jgi:hypothetical protein
VNAEVFTVTTAYDALDRVTEKVSPTTKSGSALVSTTLNTNDAGGQFYTVGVKPYGASTTTTVVRARRRTQSVCLL